MVDVLLKAQSDGLERIPRLDRKLVTSTVGVLDAGNAAAVHIDVNAQLTVVHHRKVQFNGQHIYTNELLFS